jgi:hypothetical protein
MAMMALQLFNSGFEGRQARKHSVDVLVEHRHFALGNPRLSHVVDGRADHPYVLLYDFELACQHTLDALQVGNDCIVYHGVFGASSLTGWMTSGGARSTNDEYANASAKQKLNSRQRSGYRFTGGPGISS